MPEQEGVSGTALHETRRGDEISRHVEIRSALTAFVDEPSPDPRREMLRSALGG